MTEHEDSLQSETAPAASEAADHAPRRAKYGAPARSKGPWLIGSGIAFVLIGTLVWVFWPKSDVAEVTVLGAEYSTNMRIEEYHGDPYVLIPVNAETSAVVIEAENPRDTMAIREFLDQLDTLIPGEYALELSDSTLRVIVDGIEE